MAAEKKTSRRDFLKLLGAGAVGAAAGALVTGVAGPSFLRQQFGGIEKPPEKVVRGIPETPVKIGLQTFFKGASAVLGAPIYDGALLAAEEINGERGLLGKRKIQVIQRDEAGAEETLREFQRLVDQEKIDFYVGITSSGNSPVLGPEAEKRGVLTVFADGCTDLLFERAVPKPRFVFRTTNIQSADGTACAVGAATFFPELKTFSKIKVANIHPDYSYGRNAFDHFGAAFDKLIPGEIEVVYEGWPKLNSGQYQDHITNIINKQPDLLVSSLWGGDYINFYKQALGQGLFKKTRFASAIAFGVRPDAIENDHPEGIVAGVHSNYYFTYPPPDSWPPNKHFVEAYTNKFGYPPNFEAEGAYVSVYALKTAIEKAFKFVGGWPTADEIITAMEELSLAGPAGYIRYRKENHQGYKNGVTGFAKYVPQYKFPIMSNVLHIPIEKITAPPGWEKRDSNAPTAAYDWIKSTWKKGVGPAS